MRMLDLFSGIGGFSLAAQWCWGDELEIVAFCEIDKFCQKVLHKHWPDVPIIEDVRDVTVETISNHEGHLWRTSRDERQKPSNRCHSIDLLTGGFPCQPFSCAGKRKGKEDNRWLWPEMLRVIKETRPGWVVAENVAGIVRMALDDCLSDLEGEGYSTGTVIIPACAINAPHRRDRVWIVAYTEQSCGGREFSERMSDSQRGIPEEKPTSLQSEIGETYRGDIEQSSQDVADTTWIQSGWEDERAKRKRVGECSKSIIESDPNKLNGDGTGFRSSKLPQFKEARISKEWWSTEPNVGRVVDGISTELDGTLRRLYGIGKIGEYRDSSEAISEINEFRRKILFPMWEFGQNSTASFRARLVGIYNRLSELSYCDSYEGWVLGQRIEESKELSNMWENILSSPFQETYDLQSDLLNRIGKKECEQEMARNRVDRLKSLGNAIVPQVAYQIFRVIKEIEHQNSILHGNYS